MVHTKYVLLIHNNKFLVSDVSFSLPSLPKLADIEEVIESEAQPAKRSKDNSDQLHTTYVYNQWFFPFSDNATSAVMRMQGGVAGRERTEKGHSFMMFYVFLGMLACLDAVLVLHRMLKAKIVGQLLLYGFPEYMDFRERKGELRVDGWMGRWMSG